MTEVLGNVPPRVNLRENSLRYALAGLCCISLIPGVLLERSAVAQTQATIAQAGVLSASDLAGILPPSVFFKDKIAPIQMRNSGAIRWIDGSLLWAAMVDTSGYASDVQEVYQFYFVTERQITVGGTPLPAGIYGAGVVNGKLSVLDVGGHLLLSVPAEIDATMQRPRPLQLMPAGPNAAKLCLGKRWVLLKLQP